MKLRVALTVQLMELGLLPVAAFNVVTFILDFFDLLEPSPKSKSEDAELIRTAKTGI
jgi:hypothetical protein